jgi:EamA domain-containing membrane protein RarD
MAIAVLALAACAAVVATQTWQSVRDVAIVLAVGFAIRAVVRGRSRSAQSGQSRPSN